MRRSPSIVPSVDQDVHLVLDDFGALGRSWRETDEAEIDRETVIISLLDGQYSNPVRVVAFNSAEDWSRDVSEDMADEIARRSAADGFDVPPFLENFVERHASADRCSYRCRCGRPASINGNGSSAAGEGAGAIGVSAQVQ